MCKVEAHSGLTILFKVLDSFESSRRWCFLVPRESSLWRLNIAQHATTQPSWRPLAVQPSPEIQNITLFVTVTENWGFGKLKKMPSSKSSPQIFTSHLLAPVSNGCSHRPTRWAMWLISAQIPTIRFHSMTPKFWSWKRQNIKFKRHWHDDYVLPPQGGFCYVQVSRLRNPNLPLNALKL